MKGAAEKENLWRGPKECTLFSIFHKKITHQRGNRGGGEGEDSSSHLSTTTKGVEGYLLTYKRRGRKGPS